MAYDYAAARQAGVSDSDIITALADRHNYDLKAARKSRVADGDILGALLERENSGAISQELLAPDRSLSIPQGFTEGVAQNQNLDKPTPAPATSNRYLNDLVEQRPELANHPWVQQNIAGQQALDQAQSDARVEGHTYANRGVLGSVASSLWRQGLTAQGLGINATKAVLPKELAEGAIGQEMAFVKGQQDQMNEIHGMNKQLRESTPAKFCRVPSRRRPTSPDW